MFRRVLFLTGLSALVVWTAGMKVTGPPGKQMRIFAETFLETLDEQQRGEAVMAFADQARTAWHFIPKDDRKGLPIDEMDDAERTAALRLVRAALSEVGYRKVDQIRRLESVVADLEGKDRRWPRSPNLYYLTIFGTPNDDGAWGLSFEGHHISLNLVCRDGVVVDSTPQFFGSHPAVVPDDYSGALPAGTRVLASEEDLAFRLMESLSADNLAKTIIDDEAPREMRFAGEPQAQAEDPPVGLRFGDMGPVGQSLLKDLVHLYTDAMADAIARSRLTRIENDGWTDIRFAWMGATRPGIGHYYRITGKSFLVELVNSQPDAMGNPANHLHCVFRDLTGDFDLPSE